MMSLDVDGLIEPTVLVRLLRGSLLIVGASRRLLEKGLLPLPLNVLL